MLLWGPSHFFVLSENKLFKSHICHTTSRLNGYLYASVQLLVDLVGRGQKREWCILYKEQIFPHHHKHYSASSEVSLFLSVLINRVMKD